MARKVLYTFQKNKTIKTAKRNFSISTFNALLVSTGLQINTDSTTLGVSNILIRIFPYTLLGCCELRLRLLINRKYVICMQNNPQKNMKGNLMIILDCYNVTRKTVDSEWDLNSHLRNHKSCSLTGRVQKYKNKIKNLL